jgi:hypothetical protein
MTGFDDAVDRVAKLAKGLNAPDAGDMLIHLDVDDALGPDDVVISSDLYDKMAPVFEFAGGFNVTIDDDLPPYTLRMNPASVQDCKRFVFSGEAEEVTREINRVGGDHLDPDAIDDAIDRLNAKGPQ